MLWDGGWVPMNANASALSDIRNAIVMALTATPAECREEIMQGPRLIWLADEPETTTVLALGSGSWRWADLLATPPADSALQQSSGYIRPKPIF
jgi:hypothetical protein